MRALRGHRAGILSPGSLALFGGAILVAAIAPSAQAQVETGFLPAYTLNIPASANFNTTAPTYALDNHSSFPTGSFDRVAYLLTLAGSTSTGDTNGYVYVSFDATGNFADASKIGVPYLATNMIYQGAVTNMNVSSNVAGVTAATGATGRVEFWKSNYSPGANGVYDYNDDHPSDNSGDYGSMQIFASATGPTLFAYNDWGSDGHIGDLGIGSNTTAAPAGSFGPGQINPDWTFRDNLGDYTTRTLQVFVHPVPEPASIAMIGLAGGLLFRRRPRA